MGFSSQTGSFSTSCTFKAFKVELVLQPLESGLAEPDCVVDSSIVYVCVCWGDSGRILFGAHTNCPKSQLTAVITKDGSIQRIIN